MNTEHSIDFVFGIGSHVLFLKTENVHHSITRRTTVKRGLAKRFLKPAAMLIRSIKGDWLQRSSWVVWRVFLHFFVKLNFISLYISYINCSKYTPLMYASYNGHLDVVRMLYEAGGTLSKKNMYVPKISTNWKRSCVLQLAFKIQQKCYDVR